MRHRRGVLTAGRWLLAGVVAVLVALVVGLGKGDDDVRTAAASRPAPIALNPTDVAYLQLMIPMDDGAARLFVTLAADPGVDRPLRTLAAELAGEHRAEVGGLRSLLKDGGVTERNIHAGHQMPGLVTPVQLAAVQKEPPGESRTATAAGLIGEHLRQGIVLARGERTSGGADAVRRAAAGIEDVRTKQLARLVTA